MHLAVFKIEQQLWIIIIFFNFSQLVGRNLHIVSLHSVSYGTFFMVSAWNPSRKKNWSLMYMYSVDLELINERYNIFVI